MWAEVIARLKYKEMIEKNPHWDEMFENAKVEKSDVGSIENIIDGRQTDVDDFDSHRANHITGTVIISSYSNLLTPEQDESLRDAEFLEALLVSTSNAVSRKKQYDWQDGFSEIVVTETMNLSDKKTFLCVTYHLDRLEVDEETCYNGGYSRGGNYPDA